MDGIAGRWVAEATALARENAAREHRDALLRASDWTQLPDVDMSEEEAAAWRTYRRALRAVPDQTSFPDEIEWPAAPDAAVGSTDNNDRGTP